jgi:hypothetical protein
VAKAIKVWDDEHDPIKETLKDKGQPWWWRKIVGPAVDRVNTNLPAGYRVHDISAAAGPAWCRFYAMGRCMFPRHMDDAATKEAGYAIWVPEDRGSCPRNTFKLQKECPVSEAGPDSGERITYPEAITPWEDGGQRLG